MADQTNLQMSIERMLNTRGDTLAGFLGRNRAAGVPWSRMVILLRETTGVIVTADTLHRWHRDLTKTAV